MGTLLNGVNHVAILTADMERFIRFYREAFEQVRVRLMKLGATDGTITDFGSKLSVFFHDPDGLEAEVLWNKDTAR